MRSLIMLIACTTIAGLLPLIQQTKETIPHTSSFPGWPQTFQGHNLVQLPQGEQETSFTRDFPGLVGHFTDGNHEILIRWIQHESRKLHPASDCLKGSGYTVSPRPIEKDTTGNQWGCFRATTTNRTLHVCERIYDEQGNSWSDVSSWFWAALMGHTQGPWWAITVASPEHA